MKNAIKEQIKEIRESRRQSQESVALDINTSKSSISKLETGKQSPTIYLLEQIAKALDYELVITFIDLKTPIVEEDRQKYGFAAKNDVDELAKSMQILIAEMNKLKETVQLLAEKKVSGKKKS